MNIGKIVAVETYEEVNWKPSPRMVPREDEPQSEPKTEELEEAVKV